MMPLFLIVLIFYFLMIRPQAKRQKAQRAMLENLQKGDDVIAAGGIKGKISGIKEKEDIIILKIDNDVKIEILKSSVSTVLNKE
ncbi:preprotein translocase subunit YajC [candidate division KSB1 bacterium]|nr:preprotein translocase subunit YajC [candidate division KSB1 bacterium]